MLSIDRSVITDTGSALLNSGNPVNITSIKTGSGTYTSTEDIKSRTALKSTQYSYDPTSVQVDGVNRTVSGILTNYDPDTSQAIVTSDYTITEVGLFATVNSVEVLFAIGVSYDGTEVPAFTGQNKSEIIVDWVMALSGTAQVTVESPGAYATAADLNTHIDNEVFSASGVHGIRAVDDDGVLKIQVYDDGWGDVNGGHVIVDESDTAYPYRSNLKFYNSTIVDNPADNTTEIHVEGAAIMVTPPTVVVGTYTYNGQPQGPTITWATGMEDYCIVTNATKTDAGSYTLTIALNNTHKMFWSDMTTADKTYSYTIAKATQTITLSSSSVTLDPNHLTATVTVSDNEGTLSVSSSNTNVAAVSISGDTITIVRQGSYNSSQSANITVTAAATSNYNQQTANISVTADYIPIKTFSTATDSEIAQMVAAADAGQIDLYDDCGWRVGQERTTTLSAIAASGTYDGVSWAVGETQNAQTVTLVLMHKGLYNLVTPVLDKHGNSRSKCSFIVGIKNVIGTYGYMNATATNVGSWESSARRGWCNGGLRKAFNSQLRGAFKMFVCVTGDSNSTVAGSANKTTQDYFAPPAEKEVFGSRTWSTTNEADALTQFAWYETAANRIKKLGDSGPDNAWWERSPRHENLTGFCYVTATGTAEDTSASDVGGMTFFACL